MAFIKIENIEKNYFNGKINTMALQDINVNIEKGDFSVFAGPSGSGKTTLLNMLGAMDKPTNGKILFNETDIVKLNKDQASKFRRENIGFIFQSFNLIPVLSAYENIELSLDLAKKYNGNKKQEKIMEMMNAVGIAELRDKKPYEMSGGQQQRVAIARALVKDPILVLADEPTANLDTVNGTNIIEIMKDLNKKLNITFLFSSHDKLIIDHARKVIELRDGRLVK